MRILADDRVVGTFGLPAGLKNRKKIWITKENLQRGVPGDHAWSDEVLLRVRVPDWRLRNGLVGLFVLAGLVGTAGRYAAILVAVWGVAAACARYSRLHSVDQFDPAVPRRFWPMFRGKFAATAVLYLVPVAMAIALYLCVAAVISLVRSVLTVRQLLSTQHALSSISDFFDRWVKLDDRSLFLVLLGAYLLTCLLLAWRGRVTIRPASTAGRIRRIRYGAAVALRRTVEVHGRYSGPVAATLATLASFTFLTNIVGPLGTQLRLQAVENTRDYKYAAEKIEEQLVPQVAAQLYATIQVAMPPGYRQVLSEDPFQQQVESIQQEEQKIVVPLKESDPAAERVLAAEQARIRQLQDRPDLPVIDAQHSVGAGPVAVPDDVTGGQAAVARDWAGSSALDDNRVELINDSGKDVVLQLGNDVSAPVWDNVKRQVKSQFPLMAPMVDVLSEAFSQLQETLHQKVAPLVSQVMNRADDVTASVTAAAKNIAASVDIRKLVRGHTADASRSAAHRQATLADLTKIADQLQYRADLVEGLTVNYLGFGLDAHIPDVLTSSPSQQVEVVNDLMAMIRASDEDLMRIMHAYNVEGDPTILKRNAAHAIQHLAPDLPTIITDADVSIADANCGCA